MPYKEVVPTAIRVCPYFFFQYSLTSGTVVIIAVSLPPKKLYPKGCVHTIVDAIVVKFSLPFLNLSYLFQPIYLSLTNIDVTSDDNDTIPKSFPLFLSLINNFTFRPGLAVQLIV